MLSNSSGNLVEQVAEALGPDGVWRELRRYIPSLRQPRNGALEVRGLCPFHDDHRPSWCWNLAKGIAVCHVCGDGNLSFVGFIARTTGRRPVMVLDDYCKRLGLPRPRRRILTLTDYAVAKALPVEFLSDRFGLWDGDDGLRMPYLDRDGAVIAERVRRRISERPRWKGTGTPARRMVYGLHGARWVAMVGSALAVEGESDLHVCWFHDLPALATPGASVGHKALADTVADLQLRTLYVVPDMDSSGRNWLRKLDAALSLAGWTGRLLAVRLPEKDLAELHVRHTEGFDQALNTSLFRAEPVPDVLARFDADEAAEDAKMTKTVRAILPHRDLNPTDKVILLTVADQVGCDPSRPMPVSKSKLARLAGIPRRTLYDRLPGIVAAGLLRDEGGRLYLGRGGVR